MKMRKQALLMSASICLWQTLGAAGYAQTGTERARPGGPAQAAASADNEDGAQVAIGEIVVTAQRREERLQDIPMSVTAVSGEELERANIKSINDLSFSTPGLSVVEQSPGNQLITVRGISGIRGNQPLIGIYLDEAPVSAFQSGFDAAPDLRALDLERVEVLKGPQGTLFGEGAGGGVIRFITKDPDLTDVSGELSAELAGTEDGGLSKRFAGIVNVPLAPDVFAVRIAATYDDQAGWIDRPAVGARSLENLFEPGVFVAIPGADARKNINDSQVTHVRIKALLAPADGVEIKGHVEIHRGNAGATNNVTLEPRSASNTRTPVFPDGATNSSNDYNIYNLTGNFDLGFANLLSSSTRFESTSSGVDLQYSPDLEVYFSPDAFRRRKLTAQEFRLSSATPGRLHWTAGIMYRDASQLTDETAGGAAILYYLPGANGLPELLPAPFFLPLTGSRDFVTSKQWAVYGDASFELTDQIEFGGGVRHVWDHKVQDSVGGDATFKRLTYRAFAKYKLTRNANVYVNYGTGFRSGGFNSQDVVLKGAPATYSGEDTTFLEVGFKGSTNDRKISGSVAVFTGKFRDMLEDVSDIDATGAPRQYTTNGQNARIQGVEWDVAWRPIEHLDLSFAGELLDSEITFISPLAATPTFNVGDSLGGSPKYTLAVAANYEFDLSDTATVFMNASYNRKGKQSATNRNFFGGIFPVDQLTIGSFGFANAGIGVRWSGWEATLAARNILNENRPIVAGLTGQLVQARPRTIALGLTKRF